MGTSPVPLLASKVERWTLLVQHLRGEKIGMFFGEMNQKGPKRP